MGALSSLKRAEAVLVASEKPRAWYPPAPAPPALPLPLQPGTKWSSEPLPLLLFAERRPLAWFPPLADGPAWAAEADAEGTPSLEPGGEEPADWPFRASSSSDPAAGVLNHPPAPMLLMSLPELYACTGPALAGLSAADCAGAAAPDDNGDARSDNPSSVPLAPIPLSDEKLRVALSVATTVPGGGASGMGGTISTREWRACGGPETRGRRGVPKGDRVTAAEGDDTEGEVAWLADEPVLPCEDECGRALCRRSREASRAAEAAGVFGTKSDEREPCARSWSVDMLLLPRMGGRAPEPG